MGMGHWDVDASATINASQWCWYSNGRLIPLYCSTSKLVSELVFITCHYSDILHFGLGGCPKICTWSGIVKSLCHSFIKSLTFRKTSAAIIMLFKTKKWCSWLMTESYFHTMSIWHQVFKVSRIALLVRQWIFQHWKQTQADSYLGSSCWLTHTIQYALFSKLGLEVPSFNFICCSYIWPGICKMPD